MPLYSFKNNETDETFDMMMSISDKEKFIAKSEGRISQVLGAPAIVAGVGTNLKVTEGFKEAISKVKEKYTVNSIKDY